MKGMSYRINIPRLKPDGETPGCVLRRSLMFRSFGPDSQIAKMAIVSLPVQGEHGLFQPK